MDIAFDILLVLLVLGVAVWTVATRGGFAAVIGFVAFGLLLALAWVRLAAVDVALTEAAIGSGVTGAVLIAAAARLRPTEGREGLPGAWMRLLAAILSAAVALALAALVVLASGPAPTLAPEAVAPLGGLGVGNAVTGVLLAFRSADTLLEKIVLLLALAGVWSLARDADWGRRPRPLAAARPEGALVLLGRLLPPIGIVVGVYILWVGAVAPGGAFQGGAILAAMWVLTMIAGLQQPPPVSDKGLRLLATLGPAVFLAVGFLGFLLPDGFLSYPEGLEKPVIIAIEAVLTVSIAVILGLLVAGPPWRGGQR